MVSQSSRKKENKSSRTKMTICIAHIQGIANLQNTANTANSKELFLSTPQQALWPMHIDPQTPSHFEGD